MKVKNMNGYEKRTITKKNAIINVARELFFARGVQAVSIKEIAAAAKVSQVSIYNYFHDKNTLAKATFISVIEESIAEFERILESDISFNEKLKTIVKYKRNLADNVFRSHFDEQAWDDTVLCQIFADTVRENAIKLYREFIELGKYDGAIDNSIPTDAVLDYITMSLELFQASEFLGTNAAYKKGMMKLFLNGLVGKDI
jgi:AcrR family transcriptional regulator